MNSDICATSRFVNAILAQFRSAECFEVMADGCPHLESAPRSSIHLGQNSGHMVASLVKVQSNGGQVDGQMVGQMVGQIVKCSTNYAPAGEMPVTGNYSA